MEERKLNFNTPLMSVRRFSTSGSSALENHSMDRRRTFPPYNYDSSMEQVTEPVAVPFIWEHIPGIAKDRTRPEPQSPDLVSEKGSEDRVLTELVRSSEGFTGECRDETEATGSEDNNDDSDVYSDALESLSPGESVSFSFNCSVSGLSGSEGPARKPSGTFSVDPQTRDLMMTRFLPAARAMVLEPSQFASRKQQQLAIVPYQQPEVVKRDPVGDNRVLPKEYENNIIQKYHELDLGEENESSDEDGVVDDDYEIVRGKGCGLIPKLCLLNPIPGMKVRTRGSLSAPSQAKNSFKDPYSQPETKPAVKNADDNYRSDCGTLTPKSMGLKKLSAGGSNRFNFSGELQTMRGSLSPFRRSRTDTLLPQRNVEYEHRSNHESLTPKLHGPGARPFPGRYRPFNYSGELQPTRGPLSPFSHSRADALSSQHNADGERRSHETLTPKLRGPDGKAFASGHSNLSSELQTMRASLSPYRHSRTDAFSTRQIERAPDGKPLASRHSNLSGELQTMRGSLSPYRHSRTDAFSTRQIERAPDGKPLASGHSNLSGELQTMRGSLSPYRHSRTDAFSTHQIERSRSPLAGTGVLSFSGEVEKITRNSSDFPIETRMDHAQQTAFGVEKTLYVDSCTSVARHSCSNSNSTDQELWMEPDNKVIESPMKRTERKEASSECSDTSSKDLILYNDQNLNGDGKRDFTSDSIPPLLKSPSESWLFRTLPSMPSRGPSTPKKQSPKLSSHETKWETIVKSSNLRHDHVRYSEELITHVTQKTKLKS